MHPTYDPIPSRQDTVAAIRRLRAPRRSEPAAPILVQEELLFPPAPAAELERDIADLLHAMRRSPGCLGCASRRAAGTPELAHFRVESRWSSAANFAAWTGRTLFAALAGQLRGRRLRIEPLA
ncbi:MAG: antibiotic biosynthesis monooxygenase [Rhodocyclales bacterium]|nr:antibiotic biosynthesis monooxygenase [Rhodocyclales bacterium]